MESKELCTMTQWDLSQVCKVGSTFKSQLMGGAWCSHLELRCPKQLFSTGSMELGCQCGSSALWTLVWHVRYKASAHGFLEVPSVLPMPLGGLKLSIASPHSVVSLSPLVFKCTCGFFGDAHSCRVDDRLLVLQPGIRAVPLRWDSQVQDTGPQETSQRHIISNGESSPRDLHLNTRPSSTQRPASYSAGHPMPSN